MTPEEQRIAIAESVGWTEIKVHDNGYMTGTRPRQEMEDAPQLLMGVPHYLNDLNAMHEVEERLFQSKPGHYERAWYSELVRVVTELDPSNDGWGDVYTRQHSYTAHATAAQRAEAFLKTIGKWKD